MPQSLSIGLSPFVGLPSGEQGLAQRRSGLPLVRCEIHVAGAHGQSVRLPDCGTDNDLHGHIQIEHHPPNYKGLLSVLLTKVGALRLHQVKELGHNGGDAAEVGRPRSALKRLGQSPSVNVGLESIWVDLLIGRDVHEIDRRRLQEVQIPVQVARILRKVLPGSELGRVHEDADHRAWALSPGLPHQGEMAFMEVPHRGHESHGLRQIGARRTEALVVLHHPQGGATWSA